MVSYQSNWERENRRGCLKDKELILVVVVYLRMHDVNI